MKTEFVIWLKGEKTVEKSAEAEILDLQ